MSAVMERPRRAAAIPTDATAVHGNERDGCWVDFPGLDGCETESEPSAVRDYSQYTPSLAEALREMDCGELDGPFTACEAIAYLNA